MSDAEIDALYGLPVEAFTAARNDLAAHLKKTDKAASARVKGLAKPPLVAWVVNQLHRRQSSSVGALIESGEEMRRAQASALEGGGGASMREATKKQRALVDELARSGAEILAAAGHAATDATLARLRRTLEALAAGGWGDIGPGRLDRELEPPGIDALAALLGAGGAGPSVAPSPPVAGGGPREASPEERERARDEERRRAERALAEAEAEHAARAKDAETARVALERAEQAALAAERDASELERAAKEARAKATQASRIESAARASFDAASNRAASAAKELERVRNGSTGSK